MSADTGATDDVALVLDPSIPGRAQAVLRSIDIKALPEFGAPAAVVRAKVAKRLAAHRARWVPTFLGILAVATVITGLTAGIVALVANDQQGHLRGALQPPGFWAQVFGAPPPPGKAQVIAWQANINTLHDVAAIFGVITGGMALAALLSLGFLLRLRDPRGIGTARIEAAPDWAWHAQYVVPSRDISDAECEGLWLRAAGAIGRANRSVAVKKNLVDTVPIATNTPYITWEIASLLAGTSALRARTAVIMKDSGVEEAHPGVAKTLGSQKNEDSMNIAYVDRRVKALESFAELVAEIDREIVVMDTQSKLADLNDTYLNMYARRSAGEDFDLIQEVTDGLSTYRDHIGRMLNDANESASAAFRIR
jgi:hypothetical protein